MGKRLFALLFAVAVMAAIAVGCGGGDDTTDAGTTTTTASLTKPEFVKQGNAICARTNQQFEDEFDEFNEERSLSPNAELSRTEWIQVAEEIYIPVVERQVEGLRALGAPSGEEQQVEEILKAVESGVQKAREDPSSLLVEGGGPFTEANKLANEYGLDKCGE